MSSTYAFTCCPIKPITVTLLTARPASLVPLSLVHPISSSLMLSRCRMYPDDLFIARSLQPSLVRGRTNWRPSAANLALGSYTYWIFQHSLNAFQTTHWWRVHQQDPLTLPSAARQQQAKVSYSLLVDWDLNWSWHCSRKPSEKAAYMAAKSGDLSSDGVEETPKAKKASKWAFVFFVHMGIFNRWFFTEEKARWPWLASRFISEASMYILLKNLFSDSDSSEVELVSLTRYVGQHLLDC